MTTTTVNDVSVSHDVDTTTITFNRDHKRNSLSGEIVEEALTAVCDATDRGSRLLVFRGEGRCFSAGFDFTDLAHQSDGDLLLRFVRIETLLQVVHHAPMTTAAFVHGAAYGAAADLMVACTHRICDPEARFLMPGLRFGLVLGTSRLAARANASWAHDVLESGRTFDGLDALHSGMATEILARDEWSSRFDDLREQSTLLDRDSTRRMRARLVADTRAEDLAALVRSAAKPGLVQRIRRFRGE